MKPLKPSMREKKRYILIEGKNIEKNVENAILDFTGTLGLSKAGLKWIETKKNRGILSVNREFVDKAIASFVVYPERIRVQKISGTLKSLRGFSQRKVK